LSEVAISPLGEVKRIKGGVPGNCDNPILPQLCKGKAKPDGTLTDYSTTDIPGDGGGSPMVGRLWGASWNLHTTFATIMQPNSPNCSPAAPNNNSVNRISIGTASSYHTGGANVALVDASVTFVSDTVNVTNYDQRVRTNNTDGSKQQEPAQYGVWGAMGTRSGGEPSSL